MFDPSVYVITSAGLVPGRTHVDVAIATIAGGATSIQLRAPELPDDDLLDTARAVATACRDAGVTFVVNDRVDVAMAVGADGVHLGQSDEPATGRSRLGPGRVLGVSVQDPTQALTAEVFGADYFGVTVWSTKTKLAARGVGKHPQIRQVECQRRHRGDRRLERRRCDPDRGRGRRGDIGGGGGR